MDKIKYKYLTLDQQRIIKLASVISSPTTHISGVLHKKGVGDKVLRVFLSVLAISTLDKLEKRNTQVLLLALFGLLDAECTQSLWERFTLSGGSELSALHFVPHHRNK